MLTTVGLHRRGSVASLSSIASFTLGLSQCQKTAWEELCTEFHGNGVSPEMIKAKRNEIMELFRTATTMSKIGDTTTAQDPPGSAAILPNSLELGTASVSSWSTVTTHPTVSTSADDAPVYTSLNELWYRALEIAQKRLSDRGLPPIDVSKHLSAANSDGKFIRDIVALAIGDLQATNKAQESYRMYKAITAGLSSTDKYIPIPLTLGLLVWFDMLEVCNVMALMDHYLSLHCLVWYTSYIH